jgi:urease accessory protein
MNFKRTLWPALGFLAMPAGASAHPGHDGHELTWDFSAGVIHPLTGWDHLVAMIALGLWAFQLGGRARWQVPGAFVAAMAVGAALGRSGLAVPGIEQGIAASVLVLGLLIAWRTPMAAWGSIALAAAFAVFHGFAHGAEAPASGSSIGYGAGFIAATALLHFAGIRLGSLLAPDQRAMRGLGGAIAGAGLVAMVLA